MSPLQQTIFSIILIVLIITSAVFSGSEMAYSSLNPGFLEERVKEKHVSAKLIKKHATHFNMVLSTILIGNNIVNIGASSIMSFILVQSKIDQNLIVILSTAVMTPIIVIFGEIIPKILAKSHPYKFLVFVSFFIEFWYWVFWPFTYLISKIGRKGLVTNSEVELKNILDLASKEGVLEKNESILANNALDFDSEKVAKHYIRNEDIDYLPVEASVKEAKKMFKQTYFSRLPIKKDDDFIAIVHLKDIFDANDSDNIFKYSKSVPLISSNSTLNSALEKLRISKSQMGFVVKTNNSTETIGLITIEDIIEEIVGEIYDEFDDEENITEISLQRFRVKPKTLVKNLSKAIEHEIEIDEKESDKITISNWLKNRLQRNITKNTKYTYRDIFTLKISSISKKKEYIFEITLL